MDRKEDAFSAHQDSAGLPELDVDDMASISGGCRNCGCANSATSGANQFATALPLLLANQNSSRRR